MFFCISFFDIFVFVELSLSTSGSFLSSVFRFFLYALQKKNSMFLFVFYFFCMLLFLYFNFLYFLFVYWYVLFIFLFSDLFCVCFCFRSFVRSCVYFSFVLVRDGDILLYVSGFVYALLVHLTCWFCLGAFFFFEGRVFLYKDL